MVSRSTRKGCCVRKTTSSNCLCRFLSCDAGWRHILWHDFCSRGVATFMWICIYKYIYMIHITHILWIPGWLLHVFHSVSRVFFSGWTHISWRWKQASNRARSQSLYSRTETGSTAIRGNHIAMDIFPPTYIYMGLSENVGLIFPMIASHLKTG